MALKKDEKENILKAIALFNRPEYKNKEISENAEKESGNEKLPIILIDEVVAKKYELSPETKDEELLRVLAKQNFYYFKKYPELMREIKEKYF